MLSFNKYGFNKNLLESIKELQFNEPTPVQDKVIPEILSSERDIIATAQTGTGKTAAFGLPIIQLTNNKWGALIVIQRETGLRLYKEAGTELKAEVTAPLLLSIFNPGSPLHDGSVIINNDIIDAAACILPLTESTMVEPGMGTRHRAALGISEETDSIVVVISEETSKISLAENGRFVNIGMDEMDLRRYLNERMFISSGD